MISILALSALGCAVVIGLGVMAVGFGREVGDGQLRLLMVLTFLAMFLAMTVIAFIILGNL